MPQPASVLDRDRSGTETVEFQDVLQPASCSRVAGGFDSDRNTGIQRRQFQILPLAETLSRAIPNTGGCINANSPCTGISLSPKIVCAECVWWMSFMRSMRFTR